MVHLVDADKSRLEEILRNLACALEDVAISGDFNITVTEMGDIHAVGQTDNFTKLTVDIVDDFNDTRVRYENVAGL